MSTKKRTVIVTLLAALTLGGGIAATTAATSPTDMGQETSTKSAFGGPRQEAGKGHKAGKHHGKGRGAQNGKQQGANHRGNKEDMGSVEVSKSELEDLKFMLNEERLAFDLYTLLANKYDSDELRHIASAEERHHDALLRALARAGEPVDDSKQKAGVYEYPELQKLYDKWAAQGSKSLEDAYRVGIELEKMDIADLKKILDKGDLQFTTTYQRLLRGSENHLSAFTALSEGKPLPAKSDRPQHRADSGKAKRGAGRP